MTNLSIIMKHIYLSASTATFLFQRQTIFFFVFYIKSFNDPFNFSSYSQSCGHLGALLFKVEDIIASGASCLPADLTCTEMPSYWAGPKGWYQ